ncbi:conserved hypothetical protein [delta proteobacterium NaphS2]|nr:conserved hypothetical protein [delta proteobacterium NaphS2]
MKICSDFDHLLEILLFTNPPVPAYHKGSQAPYAILIPGLGSSSYGGASIDNLFLRFCDRSFCI